MTEASPAFQYPSRINLKPQSPVLSSPLSVRVVPQTTIKPSTIFKTFDYQDIKNLNTTTRNLATNVKELEETIVEHSIASDFNTSNVLDEFQTKVRDDLRRFENVLTMLLEQQRVLVKKIKKIDERVDTKPSTLVSTNSRIDNDDEEDFIITRKRRITRSAGLQAPHVALKRRAEKSVGYIIDYNPESDEYQFSDGYYWKPRKDVDETQPELVSRWRMRYDERK